MSIIGKREVDRCIVFPLSIYKSLLNKKKRQFGSTDCCLTHNVRLTDLIVHRSAFSPGEMTREIIALFSGHVVSWICHGQTPGIISLSPDIQENEDVAMSNRGRTAVTLCGTSTRYPQNEKRPYLQHTL